MKNDLMYHVQMRKQQDIEDLKEEVQQLKERNEDIRIKLEKRISEIWRYLEDDYRPFKQQAVKNHMELQRGLQFTLLAVLIGYILGVGTILL